MSAIYKDGAWYGKGGSGGGSDIQVTTMDTASATNVGTVVQYIGDTDTNYTHDFFYECVEDSTTTPSTYSWEVVDMTEDISDADLQDLKDAFDVVNKGAPARMFNYSTDEQVIGTWVDGKPLYQKTLVINSLSSGDNDINHNISNLGEVVNAFGTVTRVISELDGKARHIIPSTGGATNINRAFDIQNIYRDTVLVTIGSGWSSYTFSDARITLQYTKTTD